MSDLRRGLTVMVLMFILVLELGAMTWQFLH